MNIIYEIDTDKKVSPENVRDAIVECFYNAHKEVLEDNMFVMLEDDNVQVESSNAQKEYIRQMIINYFVKVGGDFDKPTKEDILKVMNELKEFAKNFRKPEIIESHYSEIMQLVNKL
ncbi:MAG: hypothetical protein PHZ07_04030 [Patescibacteria group bacterium]|nr:hypothetical protein [Patescibacteria group bacterium]MDD4304480.1 hypothetical protein [Patescibacteria group bacterium]MDD4694840.1 hypothetical protein [Patescibacteria group bacterium]